MRNPVLILPQHNSHSRQVNQTNQFSHADYPAGKLTKPGASHISSTGKIVTSSELSGVGTRAVSDHQRQQNLFSPQRSGPAYHNVQNSQEKFRAQQASAQWTHDNNGPNKNTFMSAASSAGGKDGSSMQAGTFLLQEAT